MLLSCMASDCHRAPVVMLEALHDICDIIRLNLAVPHVFVILTADWWGGGDDNAGLSP